MRALLAVIAAAGAAAEEGGDTVVAASLAQIEHSLEGWRTGAAGDPPTRPAAKCFVDQVWSKKDVVLKKSIAFGSAYNNATKKQQQLLLDAYFPPDSDTRTQRPVMVLIHGGAFVSGSRTSDGEPDIAYALVQRGYVAVSIEYRLTGNFWGKGAGCHQGSGSSPPCENSDQAVIDAQDDGKAAVRFVRKMATEWNIDPDRIAIAGDSAGAITVDWMGYVPSGDGSSGNPGLSSSVGAVVPISGALQYRYWCKSTGKDGLNPKGCQGPGTAESGWEGHLTDITGKGQPTLCQVHGTADLIVPYQNAVDIKARADKVGLPNTLITVQGGGHVPISQLLSKQLDELTTCLVGGLDLANAQCPK